MNYLLNALRGLQQGRTQGLNLRPDYSANYRNPHAEFDDAIWAERQGDKEYQQNYEMAQLDLFKNLGQRPSRGGMGGSMPGSMGGGFSPKMGVDVVDTSMQMEMPDNERGQIVNNLRAHLMPYGGTQTRGPLQNRGFRKF